MKKILISGFILCIALQVFAGNTRTYSVIKIWQGIDTICYKNEHSQLLVFTPDSAKNNHAAVIICPGGSYGHLGLKHEGIEVAQWLSKLGFTAFVLKYRVGMQGYHHPAMIQDLQRSIQIVRERASVWDIEQKKVGVMGFSAGGHLVGVAGIHYNYNFLAYQGIYPKVSLRPDFVVMVYPVVSMHDSIAHKKSKRNLLGRNYSEDLIHKLSLEENVHAHVPPIFIVHALGDKVVDYRNSVYLYRELQ
ncbi:MAG TPA: alpha/beta hydrolase [Bacteroidales bacterium]|nr:alpha/beta hydrolase [Bacteroidales bacterium]